MTQAVTVAERPIDLALLKAVGLDRLAPEQRELAMHIAQRYDLDLMLKHLVMIEGRPYITRDGLLHVAHRSGVFDGIETTPPELADGDKFWRSTCTVWRKDMTRGFTYSGRYPVEGSNKRYAPEMAVKVGEVMALRRAFDVAAPAADERWDVEATTVEVEPPVRLSLAERAAAKAAEVEPEINDLDALPWTEPQQAEAAAILEAGLVSAPLQLTTVEMRDFMRQAHILPAVAMTTARDLFPDWNGRDDLTNRQRGQIWEKLNP